MRKFMLFFGIDLSPVAQISKRSAKAFGMFNKAIKKLEKLNTAIEQHKANHLSMIAQLQADHDTLQLQMEKNTKLKDKLADFTA